MAFARKESYDDNEVEYKESIDYLLLCLNHDGCETLTHAELIDILDKISIHGLIMMGIYDVLQIKTHHVMAQADKLYIKANAHELSDTINKLYSDGDCNETNFGTQKLPPALYKFRETIAEVSKLADSLKVELDDKL